MAYVINAGDLVQAQLRSTLHGQTCINTFHYFYTAPAIPLADGEDVLTAFGTSFLSQVWANNLRALLSNEVVDVHAIIQLIEPIRYVPIRVNPGVGLDTGGDLGSALPSSVSVNLKKLSDQAGRSHRGRVYIAGAFINNENNSALDPAQVAGWNDAGVDMATDVVTADGTFVPVIRHADPLQVPDLITAVVVDPVLRNQRRRQLGRGI
jgi:hypothetical protein